MTLDSVYLSIVNQSGESLDPALQLEIHQYASGRAERVELLVALAGRNDLDEHVDRMLASCRDVDVARAWTARADRDQVQLAGRVLADGRTAVLLPLATRRDLAPDVYRALGESRSSKVAFALAGNPRVPTDVRLTSVRRFVGHSPVGTWARAVERFHALCHVDSRNVAVMYEAAATTTIAPYVVACLSQPYVRDRDLAYWVRRLDDIADAAGGRWRHLLAGIVETIGRRTLPPELRQELLTRANALAERSDNPGDRNERQIWQQTLRMSLERLDGFDADLHARLEMLQNEIDATTALALIEELLTDTPSDGDRQMIVQIAGSHRFVASRDVHRLAVAHQVLVPGCLVARLESEGEHGILSALFDEHYNSANPPWLLGYLRAPQTTTLAYLRDVEASGRLWPDWTVHTLVTTEPDAVLDRVRWHAVAPIADVTAIAQRIKDALVHELGEDRSRWEAFHVLAENFEGTLEDLLGAARALSS